MSLILSALGARCRAFWEHLAGDRPPYGDALCGRWEVNRMPRPCHRNGVPVRSRERVEYHVWGGTPAECVERFLDRIDHEETAAALVARTLRRNDQWEAWGWLDIRIVEEE